MDKKLQEAFEKVQKELPKGSKEMAEALKTLEPMHELSSEIVKTIMSSDILHVEECEDNWSLLILMALAKATATVIYGIEKSSEGTMDISDNYINCMLPLTNHIVRQELSNKDTGNINDKDYDTTAKVQPVHT